MSVHRYILDNSKPYTGSVLSNTFLDENNEERVMWSGYLYNNNKEALTVDEYKERTGLSDLICLTAAELEPIHSAWEDSLKTKPEEITEEYYNEMLEILPPCRWHNLRGAIVFHMSERLTGNLVSWFISLRGKCYSFVDSCYLTDAELEEIIEKEILKWK